MTIFETKSEVTKSTDDTENCSRKTIVFHFGFSILFLLLAVFLVIYTIIYLHVPNQEFIKANERICAIEAASLSCWRRKVLSASRIEEGRYTCWKFAVATLNITSIVQYSNVDDFPLNKNGCTSAESCGQPRWICRVSNKGAIGLRWNYPTKWLIFCILAIVLQVVLCILFAIRAFRMLQKRRDSNDEKNIPTVPYFDEDNSSMFLDDDEV